MKAAAEEGRALLPVVSVMMMTTLTCLPELGNFALWIVKKREGRGLARQTRRQHKAHAHTREMTRHSNS